MWNVMRNIVMRQIERQTEIFKVNRDYEILVQSLCIEREEQIDSPSIIEIDNYFDDTCINNNTSNVA